MSFASDNWSGACPEVIDAVVRANTGSAAGYGLDGCTAQLNDRFGELFETDVVIQPVVSGTAANALALASMTSPWGLVFAHDHAHILVDESGAPEFLSGGARCVGLPGSLGKVSVDALAARLALAGHGVHSPAPCVLSLTQATEQGTVYTLDEVAERAALAADYGLAVHMDGARFANAIVALGCSPADATWRSGIDVLSFGATKGGAMDVDAIVVFSPDRVADLDRHTKRSGHLLSKMRYLSAQLLAYVDNDVWLRNAEHANRKARTLAGALDGLGIELAVPTDANMVYARFEPEVAAFLRDSGHHFYDEPVEDGLATRLVCSWDTSENEMEEFLTAVRTTLTQERLAGS